MAPEILDITGASQLLGVSTTTLYKLAREGTIPATRVGCEWRFHRQTLIQWVAGGTQADQLSSLLGKVQVQRKK